MTFSDNQTTVDDQTAIKVKYLMNMETQSTNKRWVHSRRRLQSSLNTTATKTRDMSQTTKT